jgi:hypothetical protein
MSPIASRPRSPRSSARRSAAIRRQLRAHRRHGAPGHRRRHPGVRRHIAVVAELGVEYVFNPEADVKRTQFIPAIGATGRL